MDDMVRKGLRSVENPGGSSCRDAFLMEPGNVPGRTRCVHMEGRR